MNGFDWSQLTAPVSDNDLKDMFARELGEPKVFKRKVKAQYSFEYVPADARCYCGAIPTHIEPIGTSEDDYDNELFCEDHYVQLMSRLGRIE